MISSGFKDEAARRDIAEDLDTCILVEAGAGSGKTYSLVQRMVALVKEDRCAVDKLAAVTFTRKAAAELKGRFQLALEKALADETEADKKERLNRALNDLDRCFMGTIHSFCATLLRERPIEAGLDPDFMELEELEDALLRDKVWDEYLTQLQVSSPCELEGLLQIDVEAGDLKDCYAVLCAYPDVEVVREAAPAPDLQPVRVELNKFLDRAAGLLPEIAPPKGWDTLQVIILRALRWRRLLGLEDDIRFLRLLASLDKEGNVTLNRWPDGKDAKAARERFNDFRENYITPALRAWREHRHARLVDFVLPAVEQFAQRRAQRSKLNFQDLLMNTASLLRENPEVRRYFQERYNRLLVDELQDTDPVQAEIMFYLAGQEVNEKDWRKLTPRPGALFVVGDPKQAIYRFRRADIDTYNEVKRLITESGGGVLRLTANFRSVQAIGDWVNPLFKTLFPGEATSYQAAFTSFDTVRKNGEGKACGLRTVSIPKVSGNNQALIVQIEAGRIARWIRWAIDGGVKLERTESELAAGITEMPRPDDFMILLRYKAYMDVYARALEKHGIPFQIAGGNGFSTSAEMAEVLKVLQAILDPDDPVRLVAVLRGGLLGISDNQLWKFKQAGGKFSFYTRAPSDLNNQDREIFNRAFGLLRTFRDWTRQLPASAALENILKELGVIPYALTGELGKSRSGHLLQGLELLAAAERRGITQFSSLVDYLALLMESGVEEEINVVPWEDDAVRLMNLHKAKGLEAPVVFLANPGKSVTREPAAHINRVGDTPRGYFLIEKKKAYTSETLGQPLAWDKYAGLERQYLDAEEIRLLYVAATRAKNLLVVSAYPSAPDKSPWRLFNGHFGGVPELEEAAAADVLPETGEEVTLQDLEKARAGFLGPGSPVCVSSYSTASVTSLVKGSGEGPARKTTGRGQSWGRVVHRVLEACAKRVPANLELLLENVIAEEDRAPEEKEQILTLVNEILKSSLWQRMLKSKKRFMEAPFLVKVDGTKYGCTAQTVISGVIDLVFLEEDGWVIADYKTDTVDSEEKLNELVKYYQPQVEMYRKFWESLSGEKVSEVGLYFTCVNRWVEV